jgi:LuxR family maltose regulon positive regulatory protein
MDSLPFLNTKIVIPIQAEKLVDRPHLASKIQLERANVRLILISAPAGFGKTTLVNASVRASTSRAAWVSLDDRDNDPVRFFSYLTAAIQGIDPALGRSASAVLHSQHAPDDLSFYISVFSQMLNDFSSRSEHFCLILDDFHKITHAIIHDTLIFGLDHFPPNLHLVLVTRSDPPWPLGRWRAMRQLIEIRAQDLRFSRDEAGIFLNDELSLNLPQEEISALENRTEGWIAGLVLAGMALQNLEEMQNRRLFVQEFSGSHQYILDYLTEEVLNRQPESMRSFLLKTAILDKLNASLCQAVTGEQDSDEFLKTILKTNLFMSSLDVGKEWFRYHPLLNDLLKQRLREEAGEQEISQLHQRAAAWFEAAGADEEAIDHWLAGRNYLEAQRLMVRAGRQAFEESRITTLRNWFLALPQENFPAAPELCLLRAWISLLTGSLTETERLISSVECSLPEGSPLRGEAAAIRANLMMIRGDELTQTMEEAHKALDWLPAEDASARSIVLVAVGAGCRFQGKTTQAVDAFQQSQKLGLQAGKLQTTIFASYNLGDLYAVQGKLHQAYQVYEQALSLAKIPGGSYLPSAGILLFGLAEIQYEWNHLEQAEEFLQKAIPLSREWNYVDMLLSNHLLLAQVKQAQGDQSEAKAQLEQVNKLLSENGALSAQSRLNAAARQAGIYLSMNDLQFPAGWVKTIAEPTEAELNRLESEYLVKVRVQILAGETAEFPLALAMLVRLEKSAREGERTGSLIRILATRAAAFQVEGHPQEAITTLKRALSLGEPEGYRRTFLDLGIAAVEVLDEIRKKGGKLGLSAGDLCASAKGFASGADIPVPADQPLIELLTEREMAVLRLMGRGYSNPEIAEQLILATGTIKKYTSNIYQKLGVNNRTQALLRAQKLGLL